VQVLNDGTANYLSGHDRLRALGGPWYIGDALGSVRQTLDDAGTVRATTSYDPWGTPQDTLSAPFGFTGELHHQGQVYLRARWYAPGQGRFVQRDPFAGFAEMPYSLHAYQYAYSNPLRYTDPTGRVAYCALSLTAGPAAPAVAGICIVASHAVAVFAGALIGTSIACGGGDGIICVRDGSIPGQPPVPRPVPLPPDAQPRVLPDGPQLPPTWMPPEPAPGPAPQPERPPSGGGRPAPVPFPFDVCGKPTETATEDEDRDIVYRVMAPGEHPVALTNGIWAKDPSRRVSPHRHVTHGNKESDNWISTTRNLLWALTWQSNDNQPIYLIDLDKVQSPVVDLTVPSNTVGWSPYARNLAVRASEVLVDTHIQAEAIVGTIP